jgi:hypothetical protein
MRSPRFVMPAASPATIIIGRCRRTSSSYSSSSSSSKTSDFALSLRLQEASSDRPGGYVRQDVLEFGADLAPTWWGRGSRKAARFIGDNQSIQFGWTGWVDQRADLSDIAFRP